MESKKSVPSIYCPRHPSELIQRINWKAPGPQQLFCLQCILEQKDISLFSSLKTISDFIEMASDFYHQSKKSIKPAEAQPDQYRNLIIEQTEKITQLNKHLEGEKRDIIDVFDALVQDFTKMINGEKEKYILSLDKQITNLRDWYLFFEKQLKKTYPSDEDIAFLFPTKDDLEKRLINITEANQLLEFVKEVNKDIDEMKLCFEETKNQEQSLILRALYRELKQLETLKPSYQQHSHWITVFKEKLQKEVVHLCGHGFTLKNSIKEPLKVEDIKEAIKKIQKEEAFESSIAKREEFNLIKDWLPADYNFSPTLLYKSSRDGVHANAFHKLCDGKKNTVTLVKAKFDGSDQSSVIGGFLDEAWHTKNQFIPSKNAFLFSLTSKIKCPVNSFAYAAFGGPLCGPTFGGGNDLKIQDNRGFIHPYSFLEVGKLAPHNYFLDAKTFEFSVLEIEVYHLD